MTPPAVPGELLAHLAACQDDARDRTGRLQAQITELTGQLHDAGQLLERLQLTHQTLLEIAPPATNEPEPLPPVYQQILAVFARTDGPYAPKTSATP